MVADPSKEIWKSITATLGAELREASTIKGISGLEHSVQGIAVDDTTDRVIVISAEPNPRVAALMQVDIQATMPTAKVLVARPILLDLASMARRLSNSLGIADVPVMAVANLLEGVADEKERNDLLTELATPYIEPIALALRNVTLPTLDQILAFVQQVAALDWPSIAQQLSGKPTEIVLPLGSLLSIDNLAIDRASGICPIPLYEFSEADWDLLLAGKDREEIESRLRTLGIYQYFYPAPDQLALGLAERGEHQPVEIATSIDLAPRLGHPLGINELVPPQASLTDLIEALKASDLLVDGELGVEVTPAGETRRALVRFRPREGIVSKILQRLNVNVSVSPKDFMGG